MKKRRPLLLFGRSCLLEVPHFEGVVFGRRDQDGLHGVERQPPDGVEVAAQGELGVPGLPQRVLVVADLRRRVQKPTFRTDAGGNYSVEPTAMDREVSASGGVTTVGLLRSPPSPTHKWSAFTDSSSGAVGVRCCSGTQSTLSEQEPILATFRLPADDPLYLVSHVPPPGGYSRRRSVCRPRWPR